MFPEKKLVADYRFDGIETWWPWLKSEQILFSSDETLANALVPTKQTYIMQYWLEAALKIPMPICVIGASGSGKSATIRHFLNTLPKEKFLSNTINLAANTSPKHVQELIMTKLDRRRKGVFGPPVGKSVRFYCLLFHMNMRIYSIFVFPLAFCNFDGFRASFSWMIYRYRPVIGMDLKIPWNYCGNGLIIANGLMYKIIRKSSLLIW